MRPFNTNTWIVFAFLAVATALPLQAADSSTNQITLDECIQMALEHNLDLQIARLDPLIQEYELSSTYSIYDPRFEASYLRGYQSREGDVVSGTRSESFESDTDSYELGLAGRLLYGLSYDMGFRTRRDDQNIFTFIDEEVFNTNTMLTVTNTIPVTIPQKNYDTQVGIDLRQPLLDGFLIDSDRAAIRIAKRDLQISQYEFAYQVMSLVRSVQAAYFNLLAAQEFVKVQQKALQLSTQLWEENRKKVQAGTLAPLDEKQAESEKELARANLIAAERQVLAQENDLKRLITDNFEMWQNTRLQPGEKLLAIPETFERGEAWINALQKRPDFASAKVELERQGISVKLYKNQLLPTLDLVGSYGRSGLDTGFGGSINDIEKENNPYHSFGVMFSFPLFNRQERYRLRSAREIENQLKLRLRNMHEGILASVDDSINEARSSFEQITARRQARIFAEQALDAEQKKYESGKSTSFFVLEFQQRLTDARSAEIQALADYNIALADFYFNEGTILERSNILLERR